VTLGANSGIDFDILMSHIIEYYELCWSISGKGVGAEDAYVHVVPVDRGVVANQGL